MKTFSTLSQRWVPSALGSTLEGQIYNSPVAIDTQIDLKATLTTCS